VEIGKWVCDRCRWEKVHLLEEKLQNALLDIEDPRRKNKRMEEQLRVAAASGSEVDKCDKVQGHHEGKKCLVLGDSVIQNVGTEHRNTVVECFPGIRTDQLHIVVVNRDLGNPDTVVIHVVTNGLRRAMYLDYVMVEVYALVNKAKSKFPKSRLVLSGILWCRDVSWQHISALNDRVYIKYDSQTHACQIFHVFVCV
jgi:hypothetical protein